MSGFGMVTGDPDSIRTAGGEPRSKRKFTRKEEFGGYVASWSSLLMSVLTKSLVPLYCTLDTCTLLKNQLKVAILPKSSIMRNEHRSVRYAQLAATGMHSWS
eukprot:1149202-Pelagomonas_calceolata.AAC.1